jgi:hypothetical protein
MIRVTSITVDTETTTVNITASPWVDLSGYYTVQQVNALIAGLQDQITDNQEAVTVLIEDLQLQIDTMIENSKPIPIVAVADAPTTINWQTDLVPNDDFGRTYVGRFGNIIGDIVNYYEELGTTYKQYPDFTYTKTGQSINIVTFAANVLQSGILQIIQ